jgi:hypothetical protein
MDWPAYRVHPLLSLAETHPLSLLLVHVPPLRLLLVEAQLSSLALAPPPRHRSESLLVLILPAVQAVLPFAGI